MAFPERTFDSKQTSQAPKKNVQQDVEPEPIEEEVLDIPRLSHWVCREDHVFWTRADHGGSMYKKGDVLTVEFASHESPHKYDFARGWWYPAGAKVVDLNIMRCIPQQFEPFHPDGRQASVELWKRLLVDPKKINHARANITIGHGPIFREDGSLSKSATPFSFKFEVEDRKVEVDKLGLPEPLDPVSLKRPDEPLEKFNPSDLATRGGIQ